MSFRSYIFMLMGCALIVSCTHEEKKAPVNYTPKTPTLMEPFKFHKLIEVSPGNYYDVLSWGRGGADTSSLLILHSDSVTKTYTTTTADINGQIVDAYNSDMDIDGHPEILIQAKRKDTINFTTMYAYEFYEKKVQKLDFPKLTSSQRKGYRGNDNFYITEGKLMRDFPIYEGSGASAKKTGAERKFEYTLSNNNFNVKQLSKDSTSVKDKQTVTRVTQPVEKKSTENKKSETKKSAKKHHHKEEVVHKKKKKHHRRHHSESDDDSN
ncbi:hypothetical protein [Mucilaginibacter sp. dw_454]|uniref:hypothetical protein n=1 Tax=Mucilaginibacter sp. dw_454 TaxID=2720079 RepID=UPI001BD54B0A|nr:hypothetical protein [Mucilaginibacter sp. dw_454]